MNFYRNPDERIRRLAREAIESGDTAAGYELYLMAKRAGEVEPKWKDFGKYMAESRYGPVELTVTEATHLTASNSFPDPGTSYPQHTHPWEIRGIPIRFHVHFYLHQDGVWRPYPEGDTWQSRSDTGSLSDYKRLDRNFGLSDATPGSARTAQTELRRVVNAWHAGAGSGVLSSAELGSLDRKLERLERDMDKAQKKLDEIAREIGQTYLERLAVEGIG